MCVFLVFWRQFGVRMSSYGAQSPIGYDVTKGHKNFFFYFLLDIVKEK